MVVRMVEKFKAAILLFLSSLSLIIHIPQVRGDTFTVTNLNDSGDGSLRWAIGQANGNPGVDVIVFDSSLSGTIILESPLPQVTEAVTIDGSTAGGPIIINGSAKNVSNCFTVTVWSNTTTITSLTLTGFTEYGVVVTNGLDRVILKNLNITGCGYGGIIVIRYSWGALSFGVSIDSCVIHNNSGVGVAVRASGVAISGCEIYGNGGAGVYITVDGVNSSISGPKVNRTYIHHNYAEGVLIKGNVSGSHIEKSNIIEYNGLGGVTMASDETGSPVRNIIEGNQIKFNSFQDVAIVGEGTAFNIVKNNYVTSDETKMKTLGIIVKDGADNNVIEYNIISNHYYEGIAIIGPGTDNNTVQFNKVGAFNENGNPTNDRFDGNGAGILIGNAAFPEIHYPFPVYGLSLHGPYGTMLIGNAVLQNRGAGIIFIRATDFMAIRNVVVGNELWGFYWVGSKGIATNNTVMENDLDGFRIEPYYGESASPDPPGTDDDVLSSGSISKNIIQDNGEYGIRFLDSPSWLFPENLPINNTFSGNKLGRVGYYWLGYGRVLNGPGNPVTGKTITLFKNDGDSVADYTWNAWNSEGRYGPMGFDYNYISTWEKIISGEIDNDGIVHDYNPYRFRLNGEHISETYAWDGLYPNPPGEAGGAVESPAGSGVYRYQFVQLRITPVGGVIRPINEPIALEPYTALVGLFSVIACLTFAVLTIARRRRMG